MQNSTPPHTLPPFPADKAAQTRREKGGGGGGGSASPVPARVCSTPGQMGRGKRTDALKFYCC